MIVPTADRAKATVQVKVAFRSYDARVLPEMSAKVHFLPRPSRVAVDTQPVLVVPGTAVTERNGRSVVFVVERGRAVEVPVVAGRGSGGRQRQRPPAWRRQSHRAVEESMPNPIVQVRSVSKSYRRDSMAIPVLRDISLDVPEGA